MCTASWLLEENGYHLFFNRDEQKGRAEAELPRKFIAENGTQYLMPVDPVGQGSWIATNEYGLTLCLLNYYQGETPKGELISRGQLVKTFAHHRYSEELVKAFVTLCFERYAPFTLVIFDSQLNLRKGHVKALQWDGKTLVDSLPLPHLFLALLMLTRLEAIDEKRLTAITSRKKMYKPDSTFITAIIPIKAIYLLVCTETMPIQ